MLNRGSVWSLKNTKTMAKSYDKITQLYKWKSKVLTNKLLFEHEHIMPALGYLYQKSLINQSIEKQLAVKYNGKPNFNPKLGKPYQHLK